MDAKALKLINMVLKTESGYANLKSDGGQETYRGISRRYNPRWSGWKTVNKYKPLKYGQIIKDETLENCVREFYYKNFYLKMKINKIENLLLAAHVFDHGVNAGISNGAKLLQYAINKVCKTKLEADGIIGNRTLEYANSSNSDEIAQEMINQRNSYYKALVKRKPSQNKFLKGWLNRVKKTTKECSSSNVLLTTISFDSNNIWVQILQFIWKLIKGGK